MHAPDTKKLKENGWYHERELRMPGRMLMSEAFLTLPDQSKAVLMLLMSRREWHFEGQGRRKVQVFHNKNLKIPHSEAKEYGINLKRAKIPLIEHGFIKESKIGGQLHGRRECSEYDLIEDWRLFGTPDFIPRTKERGICQSRGFADYNKQRTKAKKNVSLDADDYRPIDVNVYRRTKHA